MKTTLAGIAAAALYALQDILQRGAKIEDWKTWIVPVALAALGYLAKDAAPKNNFPKS